MTSTLLNNFRAIELYSNLLRPHLFRLAFSLLFAIGCSASAARIADVDFPERIQISKTDLVLNGVGLREAKFIFSFGVYAAGLYLPAPEKSAERILSSRDTKLLKMQFLRDVDAEKIRGAWDDSFAANCEVDCAQNKPKLDELKMKIPAMKKGDVMTCLFEPRTVTISVNDSPVVSVEGDGFPATVLANWLGKKPPNSDLKAGLLGLE